MPHTRTVTAASVIILLLTTGYLAARSNSVATASAEATLAALERFDAAADAARRAAAEERGRDLIPDCAERQRFDELLGTDTRTLRRADLDEALALYDRCGRYFERGMRYSLATMEDAVSTARAIASSTAQRSVRRDMFALADSWAAVIAAEHERVNVLAAQMDIQKRYWETERDRVAGRITAAERETAFGALNTEALQSQADMTTAIAKSDAARAASADTAGAFREKYAGEASDGPTAP